MGSTDQPTTVKAKEDVAVAHVEDAANDSAGAVTNSAVETQIAAELTSNNGAILNNSASLSTFATKLEQAGILPAFALNQLNEGRLNQWQEGDQLSVRKIQDAATGADAPLERALAQALLERLDRINTDADSAHISQSELEAWVRKPALDGRGALVTRNELGRPTEIENPPGSGKKTSYSYNENGELTGFQPPDGQGCGVQFVDGKWQWASDDHPLGDISNVTLRTDGSIKIDLTYAPGTLPSGTDGGVAPPALIQRYDGTFTTPQQTVPSEVAAPGAVTQGSEVAPDGSLQRPPSREVLAQKAIDDLALKLNQAGNATWALVVSSPDKAAVFSILEPLTAADRARVAASYEAQFKQPMEKDLVAKLGPVDGARVEALMRRWDGRSDEAGQLHVAMARLSVLRESGDLGPNRIPPGDERVRVEKDIRDTLAAMPPAELAAQLAKYKQDYGRDLLDDLNNNPQLSDATKQTLQFLTKGAGQLSSENYRQIAELGLSSQRPDIFQMAMRDGPESLRNQMKAEGVEARIDNQFYWSGAGETQIAKDYLNLGTVSLAILVNGDTHWWHTNKEEIARVMSAASSTEVKMYTDGRDAVLRGDKPAPGSPEEKAMQFYNKLHAALASAGSAPEAALWEAKLTRTSDVAQQLLQAYDAGFVFGIGSGANRNRLFGAVENLNEQDFKRLRANPDELKQIDIALATFATKEEREQVMSMLNAKLHVGDAAWTFAQSRTEGRRSLDDVFAQNSDASDRAQTTARLDALIYMSAAERQRLQDDPAYLTKVQGMLADTFGYGAPVDSILANRLLARALDKSADLSTLPPVEAVLYLSAKNESSLAVMNAMETAFSDPAFRERMNKPQTAEDRKLALYMHEVVVRAGFLANGLHDYRSPFVNFRDTYPEEARSDIDRQIFDNGRLSLDKKVWLTPDKGTRFDLIVSASPEDRQRLLNTNPDEETKLFQDAVMGTEPRVRQLLLNGVRQGGFDQADLYRAFVLDGSSKPFSQLREDTHRLTGQQRGDLANLYYTKYGSFIGSDVTAKAPPNERWQTRELFAPYEQNLRQVALDGRTNLYENTSSWDGFLKNWWDSTAVARDASVDAMSKFMVQNADAIAALPPEQQVQFRKLVDNYNQAVDAYVKSKGAAAEVLVDATITLAAFGGAVFTGGASLGLVGSLSFGAGAIYRTAMMSSIEGTNFDASMGNIFKQGFKGGTTALLMMLGPAQMGMKGVSVGAEVATVTAGAVVAKDVAGKLFKEGAETVIANGLTSLTRTSAVTGGKEFQSQIAQIAQQAINPALQGAEREAALLQAQQFITQQLGEQVARGLTNRVKAEAELYLQNVAAAELGSAGSELAATAVGVESPSTLWERLQGSATSTLAGVTFFHGIIRTGGVVMPVVLGRNKDGDLLAGPGTTVQHADGNRVTVPEGQTVKIQPGDLVAESPKVAAQPPKDTAWGKVQLDDNGDVIHIESGLGIFTKIDDKTWLREDNNRTYRMTDVTLAADGTLSYTTNRYQTTLDGATGRYSIKSPAGNEFTALRHKWGDKFVAIEFDKATGDPIVYHFPNMSLSRRADGIWVNEKGEAIAKSITFNDKDQTAQIVMADAYRKKTGIEQITRTAGGDTQVTWLHKPEMPKQPIDIATVEENFQARIIRGDVTEKDGKFFADDGVGGRTYYDKDGRPIGGHNAEGQDLTYKLSTEAVVSADGRPAIESIQYSRDGKVEYTVEKKGGTFARVYPDGHSEPLTVQGHPVDEVYVATDGAIVQRASYEKTVTMPDQSEVKARVWVEERTYPDGTRVSVDAAGHERVGAESLVAQRARLEHLKDTIFQGDEFPTQRQSRLWDMVKKFERDAQLRGTSDEEIANVYYQMNKLLSADEATLSLSVRRTLAEQLMLGLSHPEMTDQGIWKSCNVTAGQQVPLMVKSPSAVADMVTQVATTGKYITHDGHIIDMDAARGTMSEQVDTALRKPFSGDRNDFSDIDDYQRGQRNFFDQIVQSTMVNIHWQTRTFAPGEPGTFRPALTVDQVRAGVDYRPAELRYEIFSTTTPDPNNPQASENVREQVTSYRRNPPEGILKPDDKGQKWVDPLTSGEAPLMRPTESPDLSDFDIINISERITGTKDPDAYIVKKSLGRHAGKEVGNIGDLAAHLQMLQQQNRLPATIFVVPAHVVNVHAIKESPPGSGKFFVQETNQYGPDSDHWDGNYPLESLWARMGK